MPYEVKKPRPREHLSFSQLTTAAQCPEQYRLKYVEGEAREDTNMPALFGGAFHRAVEVAESLRAGNNPADYPFDANFADWLVRMTRHIIKASGIDLSLVTYYGRQDHTFWDTDRLPKMALAYVRWRLAEVAAGVDVLDMEQSNVEREVRIPINGEVLLGYVDSVMADSLDRTFPRDLKTGKKKNHHSMQLELYAWALRKQGVSVAYGQLLYYDSKKDEFVPDVVPLRLTDREVEHQIGVLAKMLHDGPWLPAGPFTGACEWCPYKDDPCPYGGVGSRGIA